MAPSNHLLGAVWRPAPLIDLMDVVTTDGLGSSMRMACPQCTAGSWTKRALRRDGAAELHGITVRAGGLAGRERRGSLYTNLCTSVYRVTRTDRASLPISICKSHRIFSTVCVRTGRAQPSGQRVAC